MSHTSSTSEVTPPVPAPRARRWRADRWRAARRRTVTYAATHAATYAAAAAGLTLAAVVACGEGGPAGGVAAPPNAPVGDALASKQGPDGGPLSAEAVAWVGREHNRVMGEVLPRLRAAYTPSWTRKDVCAFAAREVEALTRGGWVVGGEGQPLSWDAGLAGALADGLHFGGVCTTDGWGRDSFVTLAGRVAAARQPLAEGRQFADPTLSPEGNGLLTELEHMVDHSTSAAGLSAAIIAVEQQASHLPSAFDQSVVLNAASTARASAFNVESNPPYDPNPPVFDMRAGGRARGVIKADVRGCIAGAISGFFSGGRIGAGAGCFGGGVGASIAAMLLE